MAQWVKNPTSIMKMRVGSLASLSGLEDPASPGAVVQVAHGLRSRVAVAVMQAGSYSSDPTPSLGTFIHSRCGPKKAKNKNK